MAAITSLRDMGRRYAATGGADREAVARLWKAGRFASAAEMIERLVPDPASEPSPETLPVPSRRKPPAPKPRKSARLSKRPPSIESTKRPGGK